VAESGLDAETVAERVTAPVAKGSNPQFKQRRTASALAFESPQDALRQAERDNIRRAGLFFVPLCIGAILVVHFFIEGHPIWQRVYIAALASVLVLQPWVLYLARDPSSYTERRLLVPWVCLALVVAVNQLYWGPFSGGTVVSVLALAVVGPSFSLRLGMIAYLAAAAAHAIGAGLILAGYPDTGVIRGDHLGFGAQLVVSLLVQAILLMAFIFARTGRHSAEKRVTEVYAAVRVIAQREAVLAEARDDLRRALGEGREGLFTGQVLGNYQLGTVLGRGAMGEVYVGTHTETGSEAAIKVLRRSLLAEPDLVMRFVREIETTASIEDRHIVKVLEVGISEAPIPYIAMERLSGESLADMLRRKPRLPLRQLVELVEQVSSGIRVAHACDVVHRDLKPQNLFLTEHEGGSRTWKVLDFGISKLVGQGDELSEDRLVGTPQYMSPEQARGDEVDERADVYGLAAVAYRALTGHPPFARGELHAVVHDVIYSMPIEPNHLADIPEAVEVVLRVGLAKRAQDRFRSIEAFARAIENAARDRLPAALYQQAQELNQERPWAQIRSI